MKQTSTVGIMDFIRPHKGGFLCSVVLSVLGVASGIVPYFAVAKMINLLIAGEQDFSVYLLWCSIALVAFILKSVFHGFSTKASHEATFAVLSEIRRRIASKLTKVSMGYLTDTPSGKLKSSMVERVEQMEVPLAHIIPEMTSNLLVPIAVIIYLFVLDWRMALVSLITIPIGILCYMAQMKEYPKKYGAVVQAGKHMSATTVEYINGIEVIKAFNQSAASYGKFTQAVHKNAELILDWMKSTQGYSALMLLIDKGGMPTEFNIIHGGLSGGHIYPLSKTGICPLCRCRGIFGSDKTFCKPRCKRIKQGKISAERFKQHTLPDIFRRTGCRNDI